MKAWFAITAACVVLLVAGCGPTAPYKTVPVSGKITFEDGTPIPGPRVRVQFFPQIQAINAKEFPHAGSAELKPDGTFANVTTWKYADGVIPGPQKVVIQALDNKQRPTGAIDLIYGNLTTTTLTTEVTLGMPPLDLRIPKPAAAGS